MPIFGFWILLRKLGGDSCTFWFFLSPLCSIWQMLTKASWYITKGQYNWNKSAARFCHQVAAWAPYMFCNPYLVINHKNDHNWMTTKAREKTQNIFGILIFFCICLTKFKNNQILINKISHRYLSATKLCSGQNIPIVC